MVDGTRTQLHDRCRAEFLTEDRIEEALAGRGMLSVSASFPERKSE